MPTVGLRVKRAKRGSVGLYTSIASTKIGGPHMDPQIRVTPKIRVSTEVLRFPLLSDHRPSFM